MADTRSTLLVLLLLTYFIFANDSTSQARDATSRAAAERAIHEARDLLALVGNASYGAVDSVFNRTLPINSSALSLSGFEHARHYNWEALPKVQERAKERLSYALGSWGTSALQGTFEATSPPLFANITGDARGRWTRSKVFHESDIPRLNLSEYAIDGPFGTIKHSGFDRNFTHAAGDAVLGFREKAISRDLPSHASLAGNVTILSAELTLTEDGTEQEEEIPLRGVHFPRLGYSMLATTSTKFAGIFALPLFTLSTDTFDLSQRVLNETISRMLTAQENDPMHTDNPWSTETDSNQSKMSPKCEVIVYVQQIPLDAVGPSPAMYDTELRFPTGASLQPPPKMQFSMLVFSPDCGFILESEGPPDYPREQSNHLQGFKSEVLQFRARHHMLLYGTVVVLQLVSLIRQMREASTPSTRSRISFFTIALMVFADAFATIVLTTISLFFDSVWITILGTASFSLVNILLFGMRFLSDIWTAHVPERRRREQEAIEEARRARDAAIAAARERQQAAYDQTNSAQAVSADTVDDPGATPQIDTGPAATPAARTEVVDFGSLPVFMPSDQAGLLPATEQASAAAIAESRVPTFGSLYMRFSFLLVISLFLSISAITYPGTLRRIYFTLLALAYLSFWVPQIVRNIQRNCRRALKWEYVFAQSVLRLVPMAYFFGWEGNVLFAKPQRGSLAIMAAWVWIQVVMLISQEIIGPRWFVKKHWVAPAWDYHPILRSDLEGSSLPLGLADSVSLPTSPSVERQVSPIERRGSVAKDSKAGKRTFDCAICMQDLEVPVVDAGDAAEVNAATSGSLMLARRQYMVTPCRHIFHSNCLEGWMKYRLQCPICREGLPPL